MSSAVCAVKAPHLPAKEHSQLCAWRGGDKAPTCSQGVCAGSLSDAQRGLRVLVSFSLGKLEKQQQSLKFAVLKLIPGWSTDNLCHVPATGDSHWLYTLSLLVLFFSRSQVMTNSGSIYEFYSLNVKTKLEQRRIKQYPLFQKQQKKTLSLQTLA